MINTIPHFSSKKKSASSPLSQHPPLKKEEWNVMNHGNHVVKKIKSKMRSSIIGFRQRRERKGK